MKLRCSVIAALALLAASAMPASAQTAMRAGDAIDGHAIRLDANILVLAGIEVPLASDGRYAQRWAEAARRMLQELVGGQMLTVTPSEGGRDRYGRLIGQVTDQRGRWLQGELLRAGLARVWLPSSAPERLKEMLALEQEARSNRRGLWGDAFFVVLGADVIDRRHLDRLQIVEGRIKAVATVRNTTYLNFGDDWRSDFTVEINADARRAMTKAGLDFRGLQGKTVRVRGWPFWRNGPAIELKYASQIEVLD